MLWASVSGFLALGFGPWIWVSRFRVSGATQVHPKNTLSAS